MAEGGGCGVGEPEGEGEGVRVVDGDGDGEGIANVPDKIVVVPFLTESTEVVVIVGTVVPDK